MLIDHAARLQATDPTRSYLLQAPAGSGKTEILTQRFLRLLARVREPEQIIAITFTRKAAHEMRQRILDALHRAQHGLSSDHPHLQLTQQYAQEVLIKDAEYQWQLQALPQRLRITTIDALCQTLVHAMPLQDHSIPYATLQSNPYPYYHQAATQCFEYALATPEYQDAITCLLEHFDNLAANVIDILSAQLSTRDQWLFTLYQAKHQTKADLERALTVLETQTLDAFHRMIPTSLKQSLQQAAQMLATIEHDPHSPRFCLTSWHDPDTLTRVQLQGLITLCLTTQGRWRKSFDHHVGLKKDRTTPELYASLKKDSVAILEALSNLEGLHALCLKIQKLPEPHYPVQDWRVLQALFSLLPLLTAHLALVFRTKHVIDFMQVSIDAHQALSSQEHPTDLTLYVDAQLHHLLIDEFQDTSIQQYELITQLIEGFQPHDHKTLFLVGDPMQSIYRFRNAEVGLFLRVKEHGIGSIRPIFLQLSTNFRSHPTLVSWFNQQFQRIFPKNHDIASGAIEFQSATALEQPHQPSNIQAIHFTSKETEARYIVELIQQAQAEQPHFKIAILVRSRHQLPCILKALQKHRLAYQGVDIDPLSTLPHIQDAVALTQSLVEPANRLAWACFLRSPLCGLSLTDLHTLAQHHPQQSLYRALSHPEIDTQLSEDGAMRARFCYQQLHPYIEAPSQQSRSTKVFHCLQALHMTALYDDKERADIEAFLKLLETYDGDAGLDFVSFQQALQQVYSTYSTHASLHIMTIHKAKGLEFDMVILPGLSQRSGRSDTPLLRWLTLPTDIGEPLHLVSPLKACHEDEAPIYQYLSALELEKDRYEQQRLLYVAVTRARSSLYLLDHHTHFPEHTFKGLLHQIHFEEKNLTQPDEPTLPDPKPTIPRLPLSYYQPAVLSPKISPYAPMALYFDHTRARLVGIATHAIMQWICTMHPDHYADIPWSLANTMLKEGGLVGHEQTLARAEIEHHIHTIFHDPRGQWIIQQHEDEKNEYTWILREEGRTQTYTLDRTFIDHDQRWIIDFKTGSPHPKHHDQLNTYARLFRDSLYPIHCGLYYLTTASWVTWCPSESI